MLAKTKYAESVYLYYIQILPRLIFNMSFRIVLHFMSKPFPAEAFKITIRKALLFPDTFDAAAIL